MTLEQLDIAGLRHRYREGVITPSQLVTQLLDKLEQGAEGIWIHRLPAESLQGRARELEDRDPAELPLYGVPFAVKDNIDVAGLPTTAACPEFAYVAETTAPAVQRLLDAGAILVGKTNLDQFATGLNGTRSPFGACPNAFDPAYISGGSSSGSAVAVAAGQVSFALGTDTAGSGRVPAAFNHIVGLKPTRGRVSTTGVVPACRSLDCVTVFGLSAGDARQVLEVMGGFDAADPFSRAEADTASLAWPAVPAAFRFGVPKPEQLEFCGDTAAARLYSAARHALTELGGEAVEIDYAPFLEAAKLLYEGPWVSERYHAIRDFLGQSADAVHPVVRGVIEGGARYSAVDAFDGDYRLRALRRQTEAVWQEIDCLLLPTAPTVYTIAQMQADPVRLNSALGHYTNFVNLLDLSAIAVPAGFLPQGQPWGVQLVGGAWQEASLCALGDALHRNLADTAGTGFPLPTAPAPEQQPGRVQVCVCGSHMDGLSLNHQLTERGGRLLRRCRTAPHYRLYAFEAMDPPRPGMVREQDGVALDAEIWELPMSAFGSFVAGIPSPLGIGKVELEDGSTVPGFICEAYAAAQGRDISALGGWRAYLAQAS